MIDIQQERHAAKVNLAEKASGLWLEIAPHYQCTCEAEGGDDHTLACPRGVLLDCVEKIRLLAEE